MRFKGIMLEPCLLQPCFHVAGCHVADSGTLLMRADLQHVILDYDIALSVLQ